MPDMWSEVFVPRKLLAPGKDAAWRERERERTSASEYGKA